MVRLVSYMTSEEICLLKTNLLGSLSCIISLAGDVAIDGHLVNPLKNASAISCFLIGSGPPLILCPSKLPLIE